MSDPESIVDAQLQHLLELVERHRRERCEQVIAQAQEQAREILGKAHSDARARMHQAVKEIREQRERRLLSAQAQQQTRRRRQRQQADLELLKSLWQPLREALLERWRDDAAREAWARELIEQARHTLTGDNWRIEHPPDWPQAERDALRSQLPHSAEFLAAADLDAGLRICVEGTCVDGTIDGLLCQHERIEAALLARFEKMTTAGNASDA